MRLVAMTHGFYDFFVVTQFNDSRGRKNMFPGNYCSDGIVSLFAISRILASSISVQRSKKLILTVKVFGGAIFRFFAGYFGLNRGRKTQYKLELAKINCRLISLSLFIL